jgi:hypothetical protein
MEDSIWMEPHNIKKNLWKMMATWDTHGIFLTPFLDHLTVVKENTSAITTS